MTSSVLKIENLHAKADNKDILKGLTLSIKSGEIHAIMGPNGSGKSTLVNVIMGHPRYKVTKGKILFNGKNILKWSTEKRAKSGLFAAFQNPMEIPGVNFANFLRTAKNATAKKNDLRINPQDFLSILKDSANSLKISESVLERSVNDGLSGGEKKRSEILQMAILKPKIAILDEIDSGLDIDALRLTAKNIINIAKQSKTGVLLITHYQRILNYILPNHVHVILDGKIIKSGGEKLAEKLEKEGYKDYIK